MKHSSKEFNAWYAKLKREGAKLNWPINTPEAWRSYYNDGYTPLETVQSDMGYGEPAPMPDSGAQPDSQGQGEAGKV